MDSIYFYNDTTLTVNLFMPSVLNWRQRGDHGHPDHLVPGQRHHDPAGHRQRQRLVVDARPHPRLDQRRHDQRQRRRPERHHHPRQLRHDHPVVDLRRHGHRPPAHAGGAASRQRQRERRRGHLRPGGPVRQLRQHHAVVAAVAEHHVGHPHLHHLAGLHRHRERLHGQPRPVLRRARLQLHRLLGRHGQRHRRHRTASSTSAAASCWASRTCPRPTVGARCSGPTPAPPTTTGK